MTRDDRVTFLRERFAAHELVVAPCCYDAISARIIREAGFEATFMSGFGVAAARYGVPDNGLIGYAEMVETLRLICAANPDIAVVADGDTGYGNAMNVRNTVVGYARAGAAAIMIEDQAAPKRCGHMEGKTVVPLDEARMRIRAAVRARRTASTKRCAASRHSRRKAPICSFSRRRRTKTNCAVSPPRSARRRWRTSSPAARLRCSHRRVCANWVSRSRSITKRCSARSRQ